MTAVGRNPRVAVCIAGAFRHWSHSWATIKRNVVVPTGADVFVVFSNHPEELQPPTHSRNFDSGFRPRTPGAAVAKLEALRAEMGSLLRAAAVWDGSVMEPSALARWAGTAAAKASSKVAYMWRYYLKLWVAQLLARSAAGERYDIVVMMRPDLFFFRPWRFYSRGDGRFGLSVGNEAEVRFGDGEVVTHDFTNSCHNDWIAIGTLNTSTTVAQLIHHLHSARAFAPCPALVNSLRMAGERLMASYLWRAGLRRRRMDLHVDMTRELQAHEWATNAYKRPNVTRIHSTDTHRMWDLHGAIEYEKAHRRSRPMVLRAATAEHHEGGAAASTGSGTVTTHALGENDKQTLDWATTNVFGGIDASAGKHGSIGHWQWYCDDPNFDDFGDMHLAEPPSSGFNRHAAMAATSAIAAEKLRSCRKGDHIACRPILHEAGGKFPLSMVPLERVHCPQSNPFPICPHGGGGEGAPSPVDLRRPLAACRRRNLRHTQLGFVVGHGEGFPLACSTAKGASGEAATIVPCDPLPNVTRFNDKRAGRSERARPRTNHGKAPPPARLAQFT